jgi:hypothetical protein
MDVSCVRCQAAVSDDQASMSGDGWLCEACFKSWEREERQKQPKPWLHSDKRVHMDDLSPIDEAAFNRGKRARAARLFAISLALVCAGVLATTVLRNWLVNGGEIPAVLGAGPWVVVIGVMLGIWACVDWVRAR